MLLRRPGRRNSSVRQIEHGGNIRLAGGQVVYCNPPSARARRRVAERQVAADCDHRRAHTKAADRGQSLARGVSLGVAADVESHLPLIERDGLPLSIEMQLAVAGAPGRLGEPTWIREPVEPACLAPEPNDRPHRHVKRALRLVGKVLGRRQHGEEIAADGDRRPRFSRGQPIQLAVGPVVGKDRVELADAVEPCAKRPPGLVFATGVDRDLDEGAHVGLDGFVAGKRGAASFQRPAFSRDCQACRESNEGHDPAHDAVLKLEAGSWQLAAGS